MKILIADDDVIPRRVLERTLSGWGYEVTAVDSGEAAWEALTQPNPPRLAIIDWLMPDPDGLELCRRIRGRSQDESYTYLLVLTGKSETADVVNGLEAGADDYLTKPFEPAELRARLRVGRRLLDMHSQLLAAQEQLRYRATRDPLTDCWNRGAITEILTRELARAKREGQSVGVLLADVDHFKAINDSHGHPSGDSVLREMTKRILQAVRPYDSLGRWGGEEFLLVLTNCDEGNATKLATRLRLRVGETPFATPDGEVRSTISVGGAIATDPDPSRIDQLLQTADSALYKAKAEGRNRVVIAPSPA